MIVHWEVLSYRDGEASSGGFLLRLTDNRGYQGVGEARAIEGFGSGPDALEAFMADTVSVEALVATCSSLIPGNILSVPADVPVEARFAAETAMHDLLARRQGLSVCRLLGGQDVQQLHNSILVQDPEEALELATRGHRQFKLKAHGEARAWRAVFNALVESTSGAVRVRLDANGTWTRELALQQLADIPAQNVVFVEQPFAVGDLESSTWLRKETGFTVALDEGADTPDAIRKIATAAAADVIVIKPMFRGLSGAFELARVAAEEGLGTCFTHAMDGTVGRLGAMQVAAACAALPGGGEWPHGLYAPGLPRLAAEPVLEGDRLRLAAGPGLGCGAVNEAALTRLTQGHYRGGVPDLLNGFARHRSDHPALVTGEGQVLNARTLDAACNMAVAELRQQGVQEGTVVGLEGAPTASWLASLLACWRIGAIAAPLNHRSLPVEQERAARTLGCELRWPCDEVTLTASAARAGSDNAMEQSLDTPLLRVCTSGTTGAPRCVELSAGQMLFGAAASAVRLGHAPEDRWLVCLPVNHVGALAAIYRCLNNRITLELHTEFDAANLGRRLDSGEISLVSLVPAMLESVLDQRGDGSFPPSLRAILLGGAACSDRLLQRCRKSALPLALTWGMTEAGSQLATREPGDLSDLARGLPPLPFVEITTDAAGRLVARGPVVNGTLTTGDVGELTDDGRVRVRGRADDVIIRGGENIWPAEVEGVLMQHPDIHAAVVVGKAESRLGQEPVAFVMGGKTDSDMLTAWCRKRLDGFKVPSSFIQLEQLPQNAAGKIDRQALRNLLLQENT